MIDSMPIATDGAKEWWKTLPFSYDSVRLTVGLRADGFRFYPYTINIEARLHGRYLLVCGEADTQELAITKAIAELLERSAMFAHENEKTSGNSNGWAAHSSLELARTSAIFELIERDAVLAQWYTATPFLEIKHESLPVRIREWSATELSKSEFPILRVLLSTRGLGPSVTCVLMNRNGFGVASHATQMTLDGSIENAIAEACRAAHLSIRKAFWDETLKLKAGALGATEPGAHAVYYAYQEPFPDWMFGNIITWSEATDDWANSISGIELQDFKFESVMTGPVVAGFATNLKALSLNWGITDKETVLKTLAGQRLAISNLEFNNKPHIIS